MNPSRRAVPAWIALTALSWGCAGDKTPAGSLRASPSRFALAPGACATVTLDWTPARALDKLHGRPYVFVHLLDRRTKPFLVLRTFDHPLPHDWRSGEAQHDEVPVCQSALAPPLKVGSYPLTAGLYDESWGYRWPLAVEGPLVARREYGIASVQATGIRKLAPAFEFSGAWREPEPGGDAQVRGRRRLRGIGVLAVRNAGEAGKTRMALDVAPDEGSLRIESDCGPGFAETLGPGFHWIAVPASGNPGACQIRFSPASPKTGAVPGATALDVLGWEPDQKD